MPSNENAELITLCGTVENIIFSNEENGYTVFDLSCDEKPADVGDIVTAFGSVPNLAVGEKLRVEGGWSFSKNYGRQFRVEHFEVRLPRTENEILRYLSSSTVKGIGPKTAERLVELRRGHLRRDRESSRVAREAARDIG